MRIKIAKFGHFWIRHLWGLSGVLNGSGCGNLNDHQLILERIPNFIILSWVSKTIRKLSSKRRLVYIKNKVSTIRLSKALKRKSDRRTIKKVKEALYAKVSLGLFMVAIFGPFLAHFHVFGRETNKRESKMM